MVFGKIGGFECSFKQSGSNWYLSVEVEGFDAVVNTDTLLACSRRPGFAVWLARNAAAIARMQADDWVDGCYVVLVADSVFEVDLAPEEHGELDLEPRFDRAALKALIERPAFGVWLVCYAEELVGKVRLAAGADPLPNKNES